LSGREARTWSSGLTETEAMIVAALGLWNGCLCL
jgi:hypothetical protein